MMIKRLERTFPFVNPLYGDFCNRGHSYSTVTLTGKKRRCNPFRIKNCICNMCRENAEQHINFKVISRYETKSIGMTTKNA